jgi:hypothetical protein
MGEARGYEAEEGGGREGQLSGKHSVLPHLQTHVLPDLGLQVPFANLTHHTQAQEHPEETNQLCEHGLQRAFKVLRARPPTQSAGKPTSIFSLLS